MKNFTAATVLFAAIFILAGCTNIPTNGGDVTVYVTDETGKAVEGATVNAYTNYNFSGSVGDRWQGITGTITSSVTTNAQGIATLQLLPSKYAFQASKNDYETNGVEQQITPGQNRVDIRLAKTKTGETLNLNIGETGTTDSGVRVTFDSVDGGSCINGQINLSDIELNFTIFGFNYTRKISQLGEPVSIGNYKQFTLTAINGGACIKGNLDLFDMTADVLIEDTGIVTGIYTLKISNEDGTQFDVQTTPVSLQGTFCGSINNNNCGQHSGEITKNPYSAEANPGTYDYNFSAPGYEITNVKFLILAGDDKQIAVIMKKLAPTTGTITINLLDEAGNNFDLGANPTKYYIQYCPENGNPCFTNEYSLDSPTQLKDAPGLPGEYTFTFSSSGYLDARVSFTLKIGDAISTNVTMKKESLYSKANFLMNFESGKFEDLSANKNKVSLIGSPAIVTEKCKSGSCVSLSKGNGLRIETNKFNFETPSGPSTLVLDAYFTDTKGYSVFGTCPRPSETKRWTITKSPNSISGTVFDTTQTSGTNIDLAKWYNVALVHDNPNGNNVNTTVSLYINGVLQDKKTIDGLVPVAGYTGYGDATYRIGQDTCWGSYMDGLVDNVAIFNRGLTEAEIKGLASN